jgi:acetyl-CoA carboxylase beta subunit
MMARCPDCGGEVKYKAPFMVCLDCGLSFKRGEYDSVRSTIRSEFKKEMGESDEESDRKERQRKRDYHDWLMKKED